jgi:transposase
MLEAPDLGNEDGVMPKEQSPGKPTTRRYTPEEKASAVRSWVRQADIDDSHAPGVSTSESAQVKDLEQGIRELKRANEILKRAASFFGPELDRQHKK